MKNRININVKSPIIRDSKLFYKRANEAKVFLDLQKRWEAREEEASNVVNIIPRKKTGETGEIEGGLGKTTFLYQLYHEAYKPIFGENNSQNLIIDFAQQVNTDYTVCIQVLSVLQTLFAVVSDGVEDTKTNEDLEQISLKYIPNEETKSPNLPLSKIEKLLDNYKGNLVILFFDSYDNLYVNPRLSEYIENKIFALLLSKGVKIVIAGRKKLSLGNIQNIELGALSESETLRYIQAFFKHNNHALWEGKVQQFVEEHLSQIVAYTQGRPIWISLFCDFLRQDALNGDSLIQTLEDIGKNEKGKSPYEKFMHFSINSLNKLISPKSKVSARFGLELLSVAQYRVSPAMLGSFIDYPDLLIDNENVPPISNDFLEDMKRWANFSFIKEIGGNENYPVLRLHDEYFDAYEKYYWNNFPSRSRNETIDFVQEYYKEIFIRSVSYQDRDRFVLEMFEVATLTEVTNENDSDSVHTLVQEFLYEYTRGIDRSESFTDRLLGIMERFFDKNKENPLLRKEILVEIPLHRLHYYIPTSSGKFGTSIDDGIKNILEYMGINQTLYQNMIENLSAYHNAHFIPQNIQELDLTQQTILGKCIMLKAEEMIWSINPKVSLAIKYIEFAARLFYEKDNQIWLAWALHYLGFALQREAKFEVANLRHFEAMKNALKEANSAIDILNNNPNGFEKHRQLYRLFFLMRIIQRAMGNFGFYVRYTHQLAESLGIYQTIISFSITATMQMGRDINRAVINMNDKLIPMDFATEFERLSRFLEELAYDITITRRNNNNELKKLLTEFDISGTSWQYRKEDFFNYLEKNKESHKASRIKHFSLIKNLKIENPKIEALSKDRETAELFYTNGKIYLGIGDFPSAINAFKLAQQIGEKSGFEYVALEALCSLYGIAYLQKEEKRFETVQDQFKVKREELYKNGIEYPDLIARYYTIKGNYFLDKGLTQTNDSDKEKTFELAFKAYVEMVRFSIRHNENRYNLSLSILADRLKVLHSNVTNNKFKEYLRQIRRGLLEYHLQDNNLEDFLNTLELLLKINENEIGRFEDSLEPVKKSVRTFIHSAHFTKANIINYRLIEKIKSFRQEEDTKEGLASLVFSYFNEFFCHWVTRQDKKAKTSISKANEIIETEEDNAKQMALKAVMRVADAQRSYWSGEFWNIEKFILGELYYHRREFQKTKLNNDHKEWHGIIDEFRNAITEILHYVETNLEKADKKVRNPYLRVISSALEGLGQLYILLDAEEIHPSKEKIEGTPNYPLKPFDFKKDELLQKLQLLLNKDKSVTEIKPCSILLEEECIAVHYLNMARQIALLVGDDHRAANQAEMIMNAKYFAGQLLNIEEYRNYKFIQSITENVYHKEENMPFILSKYLLVRGDIIFASLFEIDHDHYKANLDYPEYIVLKKYNPKKDIWNKKDKAKIREMMHFYLSSLDILASNTIYHTLEFSNIYLEIKYRALLVHDLEYLKTIRNEFEALWNSMPNLSKKGRVRDDETLTDIFLSMDMHILSIKAKDFFELKERNGNT